MAIKTFRMRRARILRYWGELGSLQEQHEIFSTLLIFTLSLLCSMSKFWQSELVDLLQNLSKSLHLFSFLSAQSTLWNTVSHEPNTVDGNFETSNTVLSFGFRYKLWNVRYSRLIFVITISNYCIQGNGDLQTIRLHFK